MASKSSHSHIINDEAVKAFLKECNLPKESSDVPLENALLHSVDYCIQNPIEHVIAIDGGLSTVAVKATFPSSTITFFQFGALSFSLKDLEEISAKPFISPDDIAKLQELERTKLVLPTKNISLKGNSTLTYSVRKTLYDFFLEDRGDGESFIKTLQWFIFQEYDTPLESYQISTCPNCGENRILVKRVELEEWQIRCSFCRKEIFLTDVFRLHEAVDEEIGAGGIIGYVTNLIEQMLLVHTVRVILKIQPELLKKVLFIKDGPLAFFGQTANMHKPMRRLINYLFDKQNINIAGLEKSGAFVEHANEMANKMPAGQVFLLNNQHIYKFILPGDPNNAEPYAKTSYYGSKVFFKSKNEEMYVITLPTRDENVVLHPSKADFKNLDEILVNIEKLRCDMYSSSLLPVALANKLVSLSHHPSSVLLQKFAKKAVSGE
jgi:hypothetical protein